ncbi:MAG: haloacid dehalogenase type II [Dehalococcoidia bacterium]|nr:haloacid dehalogenase type II [Dehalococcoidia bacterium]
MKPVPHVDALVFDVFGTVVDWRASVTKDVADVARGMKVQGDWQKFADEWRTGYHDGMRRVNAGEWPWMNVDLIHRRKLDELLPKYGLSGLDEPERDRLNRVWHRLKPWPDSVKGLSRLKKRYVISPLSNGNFALLTNMAKSAGLPWDCILSAELTGRYKPDPQAYQKSADLLGLARGRVLMVAAHVGDLRGAQAAGLRTAFVTRPLEYGHQGTPDTAGDPSFDVSAEDFIDLAKQMGV